MRIPREFYIPQGATKVADRHSDAVAYLWSTPAGPCAMGFAGRAQKPSWHYRFANLAQREDHVRRFFAGVQARRKAVADRRQQRSRPHSLQVGHVLRTSWGYEQTNVEFFEVTGLVGTTMVELREIAAVRDETGWCRGRTLPHSGNFVGDPIRRRVDAANKSVRVDQVRTARLWDGTPVSWTAYH